MSLSYGPLTKQKNPFSKSNTYVNTVPTSSWESYENDSSSFHGSPPFESPHRYAKIHKSYDKRGSIVVDSDFDPENDHENGPNKFSKSKCFMSCFQANCTSKKNHKDGWEKKSQRGSLTHNGKVILPSNVNDESFKRDPRARFRWRVQCWTYNFLERPGRKAKYFYHLPAFTLITVCSVLYILSDLEGYKEVIKTVLDPLEIVILIQLTVEFALRIWACGCRSRYQGFRGRLKFCQRFFVILDMTIIIGSIFIIAIDNIETNKLPEVLKHTQEAESNEKSSSISSATSKIIEASSRQYPINTTEINNYDFTTFAPETSRINVIVMYTLKLLRFLPIIRIVRMDRRGNSWKLLASVVMAHSRELLTSLYIGFIVILFGSYIVYLRVGARFFLGFSRVGYASLGRSIIDLFPIRKRRTQQQLQKLRRRSLVGHRLPNHHWLRKSSPRIKYRPIRLRNFLRGRHLLLQPPSRYFRNRLRLQSSRTTPPKAFRVTEGSGCYFNPVFMEGLCST